jgi:hypothetical protein
VSTFEWASLNPSEQEYEIMEMNQLLVAEENYVGLHFVEITDEGRIKFRGYFCEGRENPESFIDGTTPRYVDPLQAVALIAAGFKETGRLPNLLEVAPIIDDGTKLHVDTYAAISP